MSPTVPADELQPELERALTERFGREVRVASLDRRPCPYGSSFALEELDVELNDGRRLALMFKDLSEGAMIETARRAKPSFLYDPLREIYVYRELLSEAGLGTAAYYGSLVDERVGRYWLFIENVPGAVLWQVGEVDVWEEAARWAASLHRSVAESGVGKPERLQRYDAAFYRTWPRRALEFAPAIEARRPGARAQIEWLASRYEPVVERLLSLPVTFIHGEFYPSNVLAGDEGARRICPIDWERAAIGPGAMDLAALVTGEWGVEHREALADAYRDACGDGAAIDRESLLETLDHCRLHLAVQWLGWATDWSPPLEHRQDWLATAMRLAGELGL